MYGLIVAHQDAIPGKPCEVGQILRGWCDARFVLVVAVVHDCPMADTGRTYRKLICVSFGTIRAGILTLPKRIRTFPLGQLPGDNPRPIRMGVPSGCAYRIVDLIA
jgi:hypothetical protein